MKKDTVVIHSGGMDSSICLAQALKDYSKDMVLSLSFSYHQRHSIEIEQAKKICSDWKVDHAVIDLNCLQAITENALMNSQVEITHRDGEPPNTLVMGRNGLMARLGAIHAQHLGARSIYMGVIEVEECNSGYRDCSRTYMDLMEKVLRIDLDDPEFSIKTPLVKMTKKQRLELARELNVLPYLLKETVTCYEGVSGAGCKMCPACVLRNDGIREFCAENPEFTLPYPI